MRKQFLFCFVTAMGSCQEEVKRRKAKKRRRKARRAKKSQFVTSIRKEAGTVGNENIRDIGPLSQCTMEQRRR